MVGVTVVEPEMRLPVEKLLSPMQEVALVLLQVRVLLCPPVMFVGLAESEAVGGCTLLTVTVAEDVTLPPAPVQVTE